MADQRLSDEEIQFRQKARQRLIGAVTLMMAAVVVLPWALDGKPRVHTHEIAVYLPASAPSSNPAPSSTEPAANAPAAPVTPVPAASATAAATPSPAHAAPGPGMAAPAPAAVPPVGSLPQKPPAGPAEPAAVAAKAAPEVRAHPVKPVLTAHAHPRHDAPETQSDAGVTRDAAAADKPARPSVTSGYVLQLGTFSEADNARQLKARLAAKGVPAFTEHLASPGGDRIRVRVGPYPSRAAAEQALSRVNALGLSGVVLNAH